MNTSKLFIAQTEFSVCVAKLILYCVECGYNLTLGDAYRDPRVSYGHPNSAHRKRLAIDLNLFKDGKFLQDTIEHKFLGNYWKTLHPLARWGGDFRDGNHYSFEWDQVAMNNSDGDNVFT